MSQIGNAYAQGLYTLAKEEDLTKQILDQLDTLNTAFLQEPDFLRLLTAPNLSKQERCAVLDDSFRGKVHPYVLNFMKILTEKGYMRHFSDCCRSYTEQFNEDNGIVEVCAVTAVALTQEQAQKLTRMLESKLGKTVALKNRIDPEVLGGVRLDYKGKRVDGTVKNRLDSVAALLKNTVL